ncbi:MAG: phosphopantothenoylcysteine decarboxylase [Phycisphaerales bacterium]|nr:MAG: phosphopantothenoylcysteine decarboxylase [Phycisphaerales bacterium]
MPHDPDHRPSAPCRLLITAGPTHEPIDAVRYLANRSSGRMGLALSEAACNCGLPTTLLLGPTGLKPPKSSHLRTFRFLTTADLQALLTAHWPEHDVLIMAAAVADYRPRRSETGGKIRRRDRNLALELEPTPDLLAALSPHTRPGQTVIGFALEPEAELQREAERKLRKKNLHAIVANPLQTMDSDRVTAVVLLRSGETLQPPRDLEKPAFAEWLLDQLPLIRSQSGD